MSKIKYVFVLLVAMFLSACQANSVKSSDPNMPSNAYLDAEGSTVGVVLCHGRDKYPTWLVVDPLRKGIHEQLGYHTLSIQMPTSEGSWRDYDILFPGAYARIKAAVKFLKEEKKVKKVYLMGHSMGSRMATAFLKENPDAGVDGFIGVGIRNGGDEPLDSELNLRMINIPVVDVYGDGGDGQDAEDAQVRSNMISDRYQQVLISGADHRFSQHEKPMVDAVVNWLKQQN